MSDEQLQAFQEFLQAKAYQAFVIKRRTPSTSRRR